MNLTPRDAEQVRIFHSFLRTVDRPPNRETINELDPQMRQWAETGDVFPFDWRDYHGWRGDDS